MTTVHHLARAVGSTGSAVPAYRVDVRAGPHQLLADEPADAGGGDSGPSPLVLLVSAWQPARPRPFACTPNVTAGSSAPSRSTPGTTSMTTAAAPS